MFKYLVGLRKLTIAFLYLVVMVTLLLAGHIDGVSFSVNTKDAMVAFFATNIGEHIISVGKDLINKVVKK